MRSSFSPDALVRFALAVAALVTLLALARTAFGDAATVFGDEPLDGDVALGILRTWIIVAGALGAAVVMAFDFSRPARAR